MTGPIGRRQKGEKVLASATTDDGVLVAGTRDTLLIGSHRIPWEQLQSADWDLESTTLRVAEVGDWGHDRPVHELVLPDPGRLLQLVRERLTASVVLQRHVAVRGRKGVFVIARRAPRGDGPLQWVYEFQEGIDPTDPAVRRAAEAALAAARDEVGLP
jgi:hypothetical protein